MGHQRQQEMERFLSVLSHELRTPLSAVMGWSQVLASGADDEMKERAIKAIQRNALALAHLVNDLLDRERMLSGKMILERELLDLRDVCLGAIETIEPAARARGLRLSIRLAPELPPVEADGARLKQVLWNLLSNAVTFTPAGGAISVDVQSCGRSVRLIVSDTGRGIPANRMPYLFAPHFQVEEGASRHDGLGLGLALVQEIVALHGGHVHAKSAGENRGATCVVELPVGKVTRSPASPSARAQRTPEETLARS